MILVRHSDNRWVRFTVRMHAVISCPILEENLDEVSRIGVLEHAISLRNISHSIVIISPIYME